MQEYSFFNWKCYSSGTTRLNLSQTGKWMYFFKMENDDFASEMCRKAVETGIVQEAKHTRAEFYKEENMPEEGVACFYLEIGDMQGHKRVLKYFLENGLIPKTKAGKYYNMPFKLDSQTLAGQYRNNFKPKLTVSDFIDLYTGEWII